MSRSVWRRAVPPRLCVLAVVFASAAGVAAAYLVTGPVSAPPSAPRLPPPPDAVLPPDSYPPEPLAPGAACPPLDAAGWLNGPPRRPAAVTVLDLWADWCPVCRYTAPGLVAAYREYHPRGVEFVSLSSNPRKAVQDFVTEFDVPWPNGFGASPAAVARFGAYSTDRMFADYHPLTPDFHDGHELNPTLFLIGPDGRVLWNDAQARPRHTKDAAGVVADLNAAIRRALAGDPRP